MADNPDKRGTPDNDLISLKQDYELAYWCRTLECNQQQLSAAVAAVGHSAIKVREYLRNRKY